MRYLALVLPTVVYESWAPTQAIQRDGSLEWVQVVSASVAASYVVRYYYSMTAIFPKGPPDGNAAHKVDIADNASIVQTFIVELGILLEKVEYS